MLSQRVIYCLVSDARQSLGGLLVGVGRVPRRALLPSGEESKYAKQRSILEDPMMGTYRKIEAVLKMFDHQELFEQVSKSSGVRLQELRSVAVWSDAVRDSRNTIHFGVAPATPNTYEKLAALLLGAVANVLILYRVKDSADTIPKGPYPPST